MKIKMAPHNLSTSLLKRLKNIFDYIIYHLSLIIYVYNPRVRHR